MEGPESFYTKCADSCPAVNGDNLHIDGGETTVSDRAAYSTGQGESGVKSETTELLWCVAGDRVGNLVDSGIHLCGSVGGHLYYMLNKTEGRVEEMRIFFGRGR
jgi:hypothetical protein